MSWRHGSLIVLVLVALLVAACGPLPADSGPAAAETSAPAATEQVTDAPAPATSAPVGPAPKPGELVSEEDYHVLGAPDAPVTILEYSDFQ
jgi:protein-disulfide isomerase